MIIAQALKLSNDLVKISVNLSQVPWNRPVKKSVDKKVSNKLFCSRLPFPWKKLLFLVLVSRRVNRCIDRRRCQLEMCSFFVCLGQRLILVHIFKDKLVIELSVDLYKTVKL